MTQQPPDRRHDYVLHQRGNDFPEGGTYDDSDREVNHAAPHGEFLEFLDHVRSPQFCSGIGGCPDAAWQTQGLTVRCADYSRERVLEGGKDCRNTIDKSVLDRIV